MNMVERVEYSLTETRPTNMKTETRNYRVIPEGTRGFTVKVTGAYATDQEWRNAAKAVCGAKAACVDASFQAERVIRLFPWWMQ